MNTLSDFDWTLVPEDTSILVAASGGSDSQTLLWALCGAGRRITVAHVNHGWRAASDDDERFVLEFCRSKSIEAVSIRINCAKTEDAARQARYAALTELAHTHACPLVAVGHTASDGLETLLLNLARGATVDGLAGIPPARPLAPGITLVRPLWRISGVAVRAALASAEWPHVEDETNASPAFARNRIRAALNALEVSPAMAVHAARGGALLREDLAYLDNQAQAAIEALTVTSAPGVLALEGGGYRMLPLALQRRVLRQVALGLGGAPGLEAIEIAREAVICGSKRTVWCWPHGVRCEWTGDAAGNRVRLWRVGD